MLPARSSMPTHRHGATGPDRASCGSAVASTSHRTCGLGRPGRRLLEVVQGGKPSRSASRVISAGRISSKGRLRHSWPRWDVCCTGGPGSRWVGLATRRRNRVSDQRLVPGNGSLVPPRSQLSGAPTTAGAARA
jgi:hypothetical protein